MTKSTVIEVECRLENLQRIAAAVRAAAGASLGAGDLDALDIAVTELCTNIIRHGHPRDPAHTFVVSITSDPDAAIVEVRDVGPQYAFDGYMMPSVDAAIDELPEGGFGLPLVHACVDQVDCARRDGMNIVRLLKKRTVGATRTEKGL